MRCGWVIGLAMMLCGTATVGWPADKQTDRLEKSAEVISDIMKTPEKGIPRDLMNKSVCVGVIPSELKGAFGLGATYGRGALVCRRNGNGAWGAPSMFTVGGVNFGFQIGGEATDFVLLVMNGRGAEKLLRDSTKLGADASAAGGPVGRTAQGATDLQMHAEILTYSRARGIFAGVSLDGQMFKQDGDSNEKLYGRKLNPRDILFKGVVAPPAAAHPLDTALTQFSPHGGEAFTPK
ncbi:MAG TPA: lipid-binding SYLF domain-containing protein [Terriglobia bacterium]|nr:lipid-binding SYLF domain-containing protein [Terriglobia bacterium]